MRICVNWLPSTLAMTAEVARRAEAAGLSGIGVGDSPRYAELYASCAFALESSSRLNVTTCVTNPVTRHWSVHASGARALHEAYGDRFRLGIGRGDSAVHTFGLSHATPRELAEFLARMREAGDTPLLLAASGPRMAETAGRGADGIIAGVGRSPGDIARLVEDADAARPADASPLEVWATIRLAVTRDHTDTAAMRRRLVPRAISASHFAFASTLEGKNIPEEYRAVMTERYGRYDYRSHGSSGATSNAAMFADRPDIEDYLLDRFAIVGTADHCRRELATLADHVDGVFLSLVFEDALEQIDRIGEVLGG